MQTLIITVDLECCHSSTKIQKILCCTQQERCELAIDKVVYEKDKVIVSGPFDAYKLSCILWRKAGRIIKNIQIDKKPPPPPSPPPEPKCKLICPYPYPPAGGAWSSPPCSCPTPGGAWSSPPCSSPTPYCRCQSKPPQPPPKQPACQCPAWSSSCYCGGGGGGYPQCVPLPMPYCPVVVCDDSATYGNCTVM